MQIAYLTQPDVQLGRLLSDLMDQRPAPQDVVLVSAFVGMQAILRLKRQIGELRKLKTHIRFVLGIDLEGTSREVLAELEEWDLEVVLVKNRIPYHTFHPKVYLFRWNHIAEIFVCSNNLTEGGFFRNYEAATRITYNLPQDQALFDSAQKQLARFINPQGPTAKLLTKNLIRQLAKSGQLPSESVARRNTERVRQRLENRLQRSEKVFGSEKIAPPPPLPHELLERLIKKLPSGKIKRRAKSQTAAQELVPTAFYMTLPKLQGPNIPGEARIPLKAVRIAELFWGWPDEYKREKSPRAGKQRIYWNWRPIWRIVNAVNQQQLSVQPVRMYLYENSADFRFYAKPLVTAGGDLGDVVRIQRVAEPDAEYECTLARQGTEAFDDWTQYCTEPVPNSPRRFGYA